MNIQSQFPGGNPDELFLTEGGTETEMMYRHGFELPEFALFPLLENSRAVTAMKHMFRSQLEVAARFQMSMMLGGLDYRASPDWAAKLGYSPQALAQATVQSIEFLRELACEYDNRVRRTLIGGIIGPRGDAYQLNRTITVEEAEDYHSVQLTTLKSADVDFACAATFNNVPEAVGVARAAYAIGIPLIISLTVDSSSRLKSGPTVAEAIEAIDVAAGDAAPVSYLLNCSHPAEFGPALTDGTWTTRLRGFRPNASKKEKLALCKLGHLEDGDPVELGHLMGNLARRYPHMNVWGGCCGTGDTHLREIARNVRHARSIT